MSRTIRRKNTKPDHMLSSGYTLIMTSVHGTDYVKQLCQERHGHTDLDRGDAKDRAIHYSDAASSYYGHGGIPREYRNLHERKFRNLWRTYLHRVSVQDADAVLEPTKRFLSKLAWWYY